LRGAPYHVVDGTVRNLFSVHLVNKDGEPATFTIEGEADDGVAVHVGHPELELGSLEDRTISVYVDAPADGFRSGRVARIRVRREGDPEDQARVLEAPILGPRR